MTVLLLRRIILSFSSPQNPLLRSLSTTPPPPPSSAVDFLVKSCGLPFSAAVSAARSLRLDDHSLSGPASILSLLRSLGFSAADVTAVVSKCPTLLRSCPDGVLRPKLLFLAAIAGPRLAELVTANPRILLRSLDNHVKPVIHLLQSFADSPDDLLLSVRRNCRLLTCNLHSTIIPNVTLLMGRGVPSSHISKLLATHPTVLMHRPDHLAEAVDTVVRFGFRPELLMFIHAVRAMSAMNRSTRDVKLERLRNWGWSDEEIGAAFRRAPLYLLVSEEKMARSVDFFMNTIGLGPTELSMQPKLLMYGLEKRILPRFAVARVLESKGLLGKGNRDKVFMWMFTCSEKIFLERYVMRYSKEAPELMDVYCCKVGVEAFDSKDREADKIIQT